MSVRTIAIVATAATAAAFVLSARPATGRRFRPTPGGWNRRSEQHHDSHSRRSRRG